MSAIWGNIQYKNELPDTPLPLQAIYRKKCKLDRIREHRTARALFGCGIQYITEESIQEQLPIHSNERQLLFTADAILDNRKELLAELSIQDTQTPDGTILYEAYQKWGHDCVSHLHGLFTIAAYELATNTLFLATDPTASRCLYYYHTEEGCTFSTLLDPLLALHPNIEKNELYIEDFLMAPGLCPNLSATETPYENVYKIAAGTCITITPEHKEVQRYWEPKQLPLSFKTAKECKAHFLSTFQNCVERALRTNKEVGIALSSGLDSSSVAAFAAKELNKRSKTLHSYTYIPYYETEIEDLPTYMVSNEKEAVLKTVSMYPNIKPKFLNTNGADFYHALPQMLSIMEIPFKAYVNLPSLNELFSTAANDHCKVFLTGQYGNATISYGDIDNVLYEMYLHKHYLSYLRTLNTYCKRAKESRKQALIGCKNYFRHSKSIQNVATKEYPVSNPFLNKELQATYPYEERYKDIKLPLSEKSALSKEQYETYLYSLNALTYLGEYETKFGLANGIVLRDPTRDPDIISFCHSIPYKYFAYNGIPRWLVRGCLKEMLPNELLTSFYRYGLQNADWAKRVALNWNSISSSVKEHLNKSFMESYLDAASVQKFFQNNETCFQESDSEESTYLFLLDILSMFLS